MTLRRNYRALLNKLIAQALCVGLLVAQVGPRASSAVAAAIRVAPVKIAAPTVPVAPMALPTAGLWAPTPQLNSNLGALAAPNSASAAVAPTAQSSPQQQPADAVAASLAAPAALPNAPQAVAPQAAAPSRGANLNAVSFKNAGREAARPSSREALSAGAKQIEQAETSGGRYAALSNLFTGRKQGAAFGNVFAADNSGDVAPTPGLRTPALADLESAALNGDIPLKERQQAVVAVAAWTDADAARAALARIAEANPAGGAADYEVHRIALQALAEKFDDVRSLRPVSPAHAEEILAKLKDDKPEMLFTDYDDTLADFNAEIAPETAAALEAASDAGVETVLLTDRPDFAKREGQVTILDSLKPLTLAQRGKLAVIASRGTRRLFYDRKGNAHLVEEVEVKWSEAERAAITEVGALVKEKYGFGDFNGKTEDLSNYGYAYFLPIGMPAATVKEAARFFEGELEKRGIDVPVSGRLPRNVDTDPPYLNMSKIDKSVGVVPYRAGLRRVEQMRDAMRFGLPGRFAKAAWKLFGRTGKRGVPIGKTLLLGDQFFDVRTADLGLVKGAPGALTLSVGGAADPRLENTFVWNKDGAEGSRQILGALGARPKSDMNKKAVVGLFAQRTVSIAAFLLTVIAYPFVAVPAVGWAGYGALMAIGPIAAIATGPLNGLIVDRLSARNAMSLNTAVRAILALVLPALAAFGVLNFWTLVIASVANGWLLSSIMTTEGAYVKRLAGLKNVGNVNNLLLINYFMLQVVLALILGIGSVVDTMGPMIPFYISAAVHAVVVLPIIWFTMPNISPSPSSIKMIEKRLTGIRARLEKARGDHRDALEQEQAKYVDLLAQRKESLAKTVAGNRAAIAEKTARIAAIESGSYADKGEEADARADAKYLQTEIAVLNKEIAKAERELANAPSSLSRTLADIGTWLRKNWLQVGLFAASIAAYVVIEAQTGMRVTLPIIGALMVWIASLDMFKALWSGRGSDPSKEQKALEEQLADNNAKLAEGAENATAIKKENKTLRAGIKQWQHRLRNAMLFMALSALMLYPLQYVGLPNIAEAVMGAEGKGLFLGNLLGALFFGNMIANAAKARMGNIRLPLIGRVTGETLLQALVLGLAAAWVYTGLVPGSLLAAAGAVLGAAAVMAAGRRLTERGWLRLFGVGYMAVWLPYLAWATNLLPFGVGPAALIAALIIGLFNGPAYVAIVSYFHRNAAQSNMGKMVGVQGSFFNAAISTGYGLLALGVALITPAFPTLLAVLGVVYVVGGVLMWRAPDVLPGMPKTFLEPKGGDKK